MGVKSFGRSKSQSPLTLVGEGMGVVGIGAALMYLFDPRLGARRRGVLRDKAFSALAEVGDCVDCTVRDMGNRLMGVAAEARHLVGSEDVADDVLVQRVRAKLGRVVSHPRAVGVRAVNGRVTLSGPVLEEEVDDLIAAVRSVRGVEGVDNALEVHANAGNVPALQGGGRREGDRLDVMQENWSPTTRAVVGAVGAGVAAAGLTYLGRARSAADAAGGLVGAALGAGLLLRATTNLPAARLTGFAAGRRAVDVRKTININAPVDLVFGFFSNYDNFPLWMHNVREVSDRGDGTSHWVVLGPAGAEVEWDAVITEYDVNRCIAWETTEDSAVAHEGVVRFLEDPGRPGVTRVDVRMSYNPPGGAAGHAAAALFGADPKSEMDADLARLKTTIESGNLPHDSAARERAGKM